MTSTRNDFGFACGPRSGELFIWRRSSRLELTCTQGMGTRMSVDNWQAELDDAKARFLKAEAEIKDLRQRIADVLCPLHIGGNVTVEEEGKVFEGVVEYIHFATKQEELLGPVVGAETGWSVGGRRFNKTTGQVGKWTFGINSFDYKPQNGRWVRQGRSLDSILGIG